MGFFVELANGIADGFRASVTDDCERGRIERLCRELGWSVDERDARKISLHFKDPLAGIRKLFISHGDEPLVLIAVYSYAILPAEKVPPEVNGYLLSRSAEMPLGAWQASCDSDGDVLFSLRYVAAGRGLTAPLFKFICEALVREAGAFDERMGRAGLLRL